jgi:endonuclease/exonuclease/phosphatase family metal-dependent hydrolase
VLFAAHFRSKVMDDPGRRLAEAQVSRRIVTDVANASPGALVVMAGDLNDTPGSPPLDALTANEGLVRAAADLPVPDQATYLFNGRGEAIDHILQAVTAAAKVVPRSAVVWRESRGFAGSDHFALTADFEIARPLP